jgi:uncharacterized protein YqjF (DUF2071 family)
MKDHTNFLTAEWRNLAIANYAIDEELLKPFLPAGTGIDRWKDTCYVSLIGFMFLNTRLQSIKIPFHKNFEEVNLRFYVKRFENGIWKRGVTFIKEFVPKPAITFVANTIYKENYETLLMQHNWVIENNTIKVEYKWKKIGWNSFQIEADYVAQPILEGSEEEFITEHYWGYTRINSLKTSEYGVEHPRWNVYNVTNYNIAVNFEAAYGERFSFLSTAKPLSVMLAEGSEIAVRSRRLL